MLLAVDIGATRLKAALFGPEGDLGESRTMLAPPLRHEGARAELDAEALWAAVQALIEGLDFEVLGLSAQRGGFVLLDEAGAPLTPLLTFLDRRADREGGDRWAWWRRHEHAVAERARRLRSPASFVAERLGAPAAECASTAPSELGAAAERLDVPRLVEPGEPLPAAGGRTLVVCGGDKNCELLGAGVHAPGCAAISFGTALSLGTMAARPPVDARGLFVSPAPRAGHVNLEAGLRFGGAALPWLDTLLGPGPEPALPEAPPPDLPLFLPFLAGNLFEPAAQATVVGLRPDTGAAQLRLALLEGFAHELRRGLVALEREAPAPESVALTGGAAHMPGLARWLAGALDRPITLPAPGTASLHGVAAVSAVALGWAHDFEEAARRYVLGESERVTAGARAVRRWAERHRRYLDLCGRLFG